MPAAPPSEPFSRNLRLLLGLVFGALLILMLATGAYAVSLMHRMHAEEEQARSQYLERSQALAGLCTSLEVYTDRVQTYILQPRLPGDSELARALDQIEGALRSYPGGRDPIEREMLSGMREMVEQQQSALRSYLGMTPAQRLGVAPRIVVEEIIPMRTRIFDCSEQLRAWNGRQFGEAGRRLLARFGAMQTGLTRLLALFLGSGFLLAIASLVYIGRLERQERHRYAELARSRSELQQLSTRLVDAQESERRSISRELHDEVGQALGALLVDIGRVSAIVSPDPELQEELGRMKKVAEQTVQTVRNIALLLRPSMLDDLGLAPALEWQGREISRRGEMEVEVRSEGIPEELPDDYRVCIYRLVQEALNNASRHSGAKNASVDVTRRGDSITVSVRDDGRGFDPARTRGLGILGMEERVKRLGGSVAIDSAPGRGTTVTAVLPAPAGEGA